MRSELLAARGNRVPPALDEKRLTSWNALMIPALAEAGAELAGLTHGHPTGRLASGAFAALYMAIKRMKDIT